MSVNISANISANISVINVYLMYYLTSEDSEYSEELFSLSR